MSNAKGQSAATILVNGPDPSGEAYWDGLAQRTALELSGEGSPGTVRVGMLGSPERTAYGDLGPLQIFPLSYGAGNAFAALNAGQALPAPSSPTSGSTDLRAYVAEFQ